MKNFYILVGNIGSGKSTYIKKNYKGGVIVSKDGLRYSIGGGQYIFNRFYEPIIHATSCYMADKFCSIEIPEIILDETNVIKKGREQFIKIAKKYGYKVIAIKFPRLNKKEAVDRRMTNPHCQYDRKIWEEVWRKFNNRYTEPTLEEGFDEIINVDIKEVI